MAFPAPGQWPVNADFPACLLLGYAEGHSPALIMGDFNARPESDVLATFAQAGFPDPAETLGPEAFTSGDGKRIDYVLVTPDIAVRDIRIPEVWTSDHKPVAADLTLPGAAHRPGDQRIAPAVFDAAL